MADGEIRIVHALPGRVRLKVDKLRANPPLARLMQERLGAVPGIRGVEATPLTASVLVQFDPKAITTPESLQALSGTLTNLFPGLDLAQLADFLSPSLAGTVTAPSWYEVVMDFLAGITTRATQALGNLADLRIVIPLVLLGFGLPMVLKK